MSKHLVIFENQKVFMANRFKAYTHEVLTDEAGQEEWSHHSMVLRRVPGHTIDRIFWKTETGDYSLEENQNVTQQIFVKRGDDPKLLMGWGATKITCVGDIPVSCLNVAAQYAGDIPLTIGRLQNER